MASQCHKFTVTFSVTHTEKNKLGKKEKSMLL